MESIYTGIYTHLQQWKWHARVSQHNNNHGIVIILIWKNLLIITTSCPPLVLPAAQISTEIIIPLNSSSVDIGGGNSELWKEIKEASCCSLKEGHSLTSELKFSAAESCPRLLQIKEHAAQINSARRTILGVCTSVVVSSTCSRHLVVVRCVIELGK